MCAMEFFIETHQTLHEFQKNQELCDVILRGKEGEESFPAHRVILAAKSSFFKAMFTSEMKENQNREVTLQTLNSNALRKIITYCYTGEIDLEPNDVEELLGGAHMLGLNHIQKECFAFLRNNIDSNNCYGIACLADKYNSIELQRIAESFTLKNFRSVVNSSDFQELNYDNLSRLISHNNLNVLNEGDVYEAVIKWVKYKSDERKSKLKNLLAHVRFPMLTRKFLIDKVTKEELIISDSACREYLYNALDYHLVPERRNLINECVPRACFSSGVYVIGGENRTGPLSTVELFDLNNESWHQCAPLSIPRKHPAVVLLGGVIFCIGGIDSNGIDLQSVEKYEPTLNQWTTAISMKNCKGAVSVSVLDGWIYAAGGSNEGSSLKYVERYDPVCDSWTQVKSMKISRSHFGTGVLNNKLYAIGGYSNIHEVDYCEIYDPLINKWKDLAELNKPRMDHGVAIFGEKLFTIGGISNCEILDCIEKYNKGLNMWLIIKHTLDPRTGANVLLVNNETEDNWLFIIGGIDGSHCYHSSVKQINMKSVDYTIESGKGMTEPRAYGGAVTL